MSADKRKGKEDKNSNEKLPFDYILNSKNSDKSDYDISIEDDYVDNDIKEITDFNEVKNRDNIPIPPDTVRTVEETTKEVKLKKEYFGAEKKTRDNKEIIIIGIKLMSITLVMTLLLALINQITFKRINTQTQAEKETAMQKIFANAKFEEQNIAQFNLDSDIKSVYSAKLITEEIEGEIKTEYIGYCISLSTNGFGGPIDLIVGVNMNNKVEGVGVINHTETPNIGTKPLLESFLNRFIGIGYPIEFTKTNQGVNAISGATITSNAVKVGINNALLAVAKIEEAKNNDGE